MLGWFNLLFLCSQEGSVLQTLLMGKPLLCFLLSPNLQVRLGLWVLPTASSHVGIYLRQVMTSLTPYPPPW